jgi:hypothetical protein
MLPNRNTSLWSTSSLLGIVFKNSDQQSSGEAASPLNERGGSKLSLIDCKLKPYKEGHFWHSLFQTVHRREGLLS